MKDWLDTYREFTEDFEHPKEFNQWVGILTLAVAAGRRVWLEEANSRVWPNLYVILVGPSGVGKGQSMRQALPFLDAARVPRSPDQITIQQLVVDMSQCMVKSPEGKLITPYLVWAEELPSFLGMDAWRSGKLADLTTLWDCAESWRSETKNKGKFEVNGPYVCMLGGTTPNGIYDVLPPASIGQGFTSRVIFVWADKYNKRVPIKPWNEKHRLLQGELLEGIERVSKISGPMKLSDVATVLWADYYRNRVDPVEEFSDTRIQGFAARGPLYVKKLAVLMRLSDPTPGMEIEAHHLEQAIQIIEGLYSKLRLVYDEIAPSEVVRAYPKIIKALLRMGGKDIQHSALMQRFSHQLGRRDFAEAMAGLEDMGVVIVEQKVNGGRVGKWYSIAPKELNKVFK